MNQWKLEKDGWHYNQDGNQRWRPRKDGIGNEVETVTVGETMTQQQYKDDCDVNLIMERFMKTGEITHLAKQELIEGDFSSLPSYREALDTVNRARDMFGELPAKVRLQFENDPQKLLEFMKDDNNYDEALKLGLIQKKPEPIDPQKGVIDAIKEVARNTARPKKKEPEE